MRGRRQVYTALTSGAAYAHNAQLKEDTRFVCIHREHGGGIGSSPVI